MKNNFVPRSPFTTFVLFLIFNRPDTTQKVFDAIKKAKPKQLFVAADGPRLDKVGEIEKCRKTREIATSVDWDCEVKTLFRDKNLGCKMAISSAIEWFFENVEEGIILEGDCLPGQSFFWFCQELLEYYRNDTRIMHISANNFQFGRVRGEGSYYFSKYPHIWGWATWRRAWKHYEINMKNLEEFKKEVQINNVFNIKQQQKYWMKIFQLVHEGKIDTWDYQWGYACFINNGLCVTPNVNLVSNIGFGKEALHTKDPNSIFSNMKIKNIQKIKHPDFILADKTADYFTSKLCFGNKNIFERAKNKALRIIRKLYEMVITQKENKMVM
jgi:hypothetical protein